MTVTLNLQEEDERRLTQKARAAGIDVQSYVESIVRAAAALPPINEVLAPVRSAFRDSGMNDDELGELLEKAKHEMSAEQHRRRGV